MKSITEIMNIVRGWLRRPVQVDVYHDVHIDYNHKAGHYRVSNEFEQREMAASSARSDRAGARAADHHRRGILDMVARRQIADARGEAQRRLQLLMHPSSGTWLGQYNPYSDPEAPRREIHTGAFDD